MSSPLLDKSKAFALCIIRVCNEIKKEKRESVLTNQLLRSGTSIGANIREAFYAHGKADFIAKKADCLKGVFGKRILAGIVDGKRLLSGCVYYGTVHRSEEAFGIFHQYSEKEYQVMRIISHFSLAKFSR